MTSQTLARHYSGSHTFSKSKIEDINERVNVSNMTGFCVIFAIFTAGLVANVVVASKIVAIGTIFLPASAFIYALTYPCSDIVAEVYGRKYANKLVIGGFVAYALALVTISAAVAMPSAPFWLKQDAFETVLGSSLRVTCAALITYVITQFLDVYLFSYIRSKTGAKNLWLRNNGSTLVSQTIANILFVSIAFLGTIPFENWIELFTNNLMARYALALSDTALVYMGVYTLFRLYPELKH